MTREKPTAVPPIEERGRTTEPDVGFPTILVVDDDPTTLDTFGEILSLRGYGVRTAADVEATLRELDAAPVDAILVDLRKPVDQRHRLALSSPPG